MTHGCSSVQSMDGRSTVFDVNAPVLTQLICLPSPARLSPLWPSGFIPPPLLGSSPCDPATCRARSPSYLHDVSALQMGPLPPAIPRSPASRVLTQPDRR